MSHSLSEFAAAIVSNSYLTPCPTEDKLKAQPGRNATSLSPHEP